jgi:hypothetical protein
MINYKALKKTKLPKNEIWQKYILQKFYFIIFGFYG